MTKKIDIDTLLERIEALELRLDKLDPVSKRKLPNKKDQISDIKSNLDEWAQKFPTVAIEREVQDVYRYVYGCDNDKNCKYQESEYKDMVIFCNKCNSQKKIIKTVRA